MDFYSSLLNPTPESQQQNNIPCQDPMMNGGIYTGQVPNQDFSMNNMFYQQYISAGVNYPNQMYQEQSMYGMNYQAVNGVGYPRVNKAMILQEIQNYVFNMTKVPVAKVIKLDELDNKFRHACVQVGDVSFLDVNYFPVPMLGINVAFYFCTACGNLYIQKDFM